MKETLIFLIRLAINCFGMWLVIGWFAYSGDNSIGIAIIAGIIFTVINTVIKPFVKLLSLPFIIVTLGLFTLVVNAAMIALTLLFVPDVTISFWPAVGAGLLMSAINYLANLIIMPYNKTTS